VSNTYEIAELTLALLFDNPNSGMNLRVSGGPITLVIPEAHPSQSTTDAVTWRCPAMRPTYELRVRAWYEDRTVKAEIHRITGIAQHPANPDPYEVIGTIAEPSFAIATDRLRRALSNAVPAGTQLGIDELIAQDRIFERRAVLDEQAIASGRDEELESFLEHAIDSGFELSMERPASHFSLWLYPGVTHGWEILVRVTRTEAGYVVAMQDRIVSENLLLQHRASTKDEVKNFVTSYFARVHAFQFSEMRVYRSGASAG